ncbi:MAG: homocysteine S-methyltransferase [Actinomycetes bacterium]
MTQSLFAHEPVVVIDGGLSTALELLGADVSGSLWTAWTVVDNPALLERAHRSFVEAGSQIIATASYQCGHSQFESCGLTPAQSRQALLNTTLIARRAVAGTNTLVAASIGPFGACLADGSEYTGRYDVEWSDVEDYHRHKLNILVDSGADLIAVETIPLADEARLIAEILQECGSPPAWFSFGFADGAVTYGGDTVAQAVTSVVDYDNLVGVGINCTHPNYVEGLLRAMGQLAPTTAFVVYPNHGREWDAVGRCWIGSGELIPSTAELTRWVQLGAKFIGGCCGVGPDEIAELARRSRHLD